MASFVVDFQAFKTLRNEFILKELAIVGVDTNLVAQCLIKPEIPFLHLPLKLQMSTSYLTRFVHKIRWCDGYMSTTDAIHLLRNTLKGASRIYCKGSERVK